MDKETVIKEIAELEAMGMNALGYLKYVHFECAKRKAEQEWAEIERMYYEYKKETAK